MTIYILLVLVVTAVIAAVTIRPRRNLRWAFWIAAPLVAAAILVAEFRGLRPIGPPTIFDILLIVFVLCLFGYNASREPQVRRWWASRRR